MKETATMTLLERSVAIVYQAANLRFLASIHAYPNTAFEKEAVLCEAIEHAWPEVVEMVKTGEKKDA